MQPNWVVEQFTTCEAGASSALDPELIPSNQLAWLRNGRIRGGKQHTRPFLRERLVLPDGLVQGGCYFSVQGGMLIMQIAGRIYRLRIGNRDSDFSAEEIPLDYINSPVLPTAWMVQTVGSLVIQDGQSRAIIYDGSTARRSDPAENEVPLGRMMAYVNGRLWVAVGSNELEAGDIVTDQFQSELKFTETGYFLGGGKFRFPSALTGLKGLPSSGAAGYGALAIFSLEQTYMARADIASRDLWAQMPGFIQALLLSTGSIGQYGIAEVNQDLYWRDGDGGIRSLRSAIADETGGPGLSPISREVSRIVDFESVHRLVNCSAINFGNRLLVTASPFINRYGKTSFRDIVSLDFSPISSMRGKSAPSYDGEWDGLLFDLLLTGKFDGTKRGFAVSTDYDGKNRLWEIVDTANQEADEFYGCFGTAQGFESVVPMIAEYPSRAWGAPSERKRLQRCDVYLSDIEGDCELDVYYRPDNYQKWTQWGDTVEFCAKVTDEEGATPHVWKNLLGQERPQVKTLTIDTDINNLTDFAKQVGFQFQIRTVLRGKAKIHQLNVYAQVINQTQFADREITDALCRENDVTGNEIEYLITPGCTMPVGTALCELEANLVPAFDGDWSVFEYPISVDPSGIVLTGGQDGNNLSVTVPQFGDYIFRLSSEGRTLDYPYEFSCNGQYFLDLEGVANDGTAFNSALGISVFIYEGTSELTLAGKVAYEFFGAVVDITSMITAAWSETSVSVVFLAEYASEEVAAEITLTDQSGVIEESVSGVDGEISSGLSAESITILNLGTSSFTAQLDVPSVETPPDEIPGLITWYDASQIVGKVDGDNLASLTDIAGFVNLVSLNSPTWDPIYKTNIQNGLPCMRFGAPGPTLLRNPALVNLPGLSTIFIVARIRTATFDNAATNNGGAIIITSPFNTVNLEGEEVPSTEWYLTSSQASEYRINGTVNALGFGNPTVSSIYEWNGINQGPGNREYTLGIGDSLLNWLEFDLFELAIYEGNLTTEQRTGIMNYFSNKWGISI
jgi:hypothetical protein